MSNLPNYHCPDCDAIDCLHCVCLEDCEPCQDYSKNIVNDGYSEKPVNATEYTVSTLPKSQGAE